MRTFFIKKIAQFFISGFLLVLSGGAAMAQCTAAFVYTIGASGSVTFQSISTPTGSGTVYHWEFGDGNTFTSNNGTLVTAVNSYSSNGVYPVALNFTTGACSDTLSQFLMINSVSAGTCVPTASIGASPGTNVNYTYTSLSTNTTSSTSYQWMYGDLSNGSGAVSSHTYANPGPYTVYLIANNGGTACIHCASVAVTAGLVDFVASTIGNGQYTLTSFSAPNNSNTAYSWNFGNGQPIYTVTGTPTAAITYTSNGAYPVTLQFGNAAPNYSGSVTKTLVVSSFTNPTTCNLNANFTYIQYSGGILFQNNSSGTYSGTVFNWSFGDNTSSTIISPAHTYSAPGIYTVQLFAYNPAFSASCSSVYIQTVSVCSLNLSSAVQPSASVVSLTATALPSSTNTNYSWNFWNGSSSQGLNLTTANSSYTTNGIYSVTCSIASAVPFCSLSVTTLVNTTCTLNANFSYTTGANGQVNFASTSTGTNGATSYTWNFGDNSSLGFGSSLGHTYTANGTYTVNLLINLGSCLASTNIPITIANVSSCQATFTTSTLGGGSVLFTSTSSGTNSGTNYLWSFGNGSTLSAVGIPTAICNYSVAGSYIATLSISSPSIGCNSTFTQVVVVTTGSCNLQALFNASTLSSNSFSFTNISTGTVSGSTYTWSYGDGQQSYSVNANHSYSNSGQYTVMLIVNNNVSGFTCADTATLTINSSFGCNLLANFSHTVGSNGTVSYSNTSSILSNSLNIKRSWNFGDGIVSAANNPTHTYSNAGSYLVSLLLHDSIVPSCRDSAYQYINVTGIACNAISNFTLVSTGTPGNWYAIPNYPWNVSSATWDWGDGNTSNTLYTSHQYSAAGTYSVCLTVTTSCGSSSSYCFAQYLNKGSENSALVNINVIPPALGLGISENTFGNQSFIYPNPNKGMFKLSLSGLSSEALQLSVFNILGACVYAETIMPEEAELVREINLNEQTNGVYFLRISHGNRHLSKKIVVEH